VERTGVTAVVPPSLPLPAGTAVLNGAGELTGSLEIREWGILETPVYLTSTHAVGRVYDGAVSVAMARDSRVGVDDVVIPVVGECDDSWLSDARIPHVQADDVARAVAAASADFEQGAVGAGKGMSCFDWKGGIGSSSRRAGDHTVAALLLTNFGSSEQLRVDGVPVGQLLDERPGEAPALGGSCIAVLATDAARAARATRRPRARAGGLGRASRQRRDLRCVRHLRRALVPGLPGARSALPGRRRRDGGGGPLLAVGCRRHDRPGRASRTGAAAGQGARALPRARHVAAVEG
jgi:D-aminopeptidase